MKYLVTSFLMLAFLAQAFATVDQKYKMEKFVDSLENLFLSDYAMLEWKKEKFDWDPTSKLQEIRQGIQDDKITSLDHFHQNLHGFIASTKDWHVGMRFERTASSKLNFEVRSAEGRYFIVWIDRKKLPKEVFPFNKGDELVSMDGKSIKDIIKSLNLNEDKTGETFAEMSLTHRRARSGELDLPQGNSLFVFKKKSDKFKKEYTHSLTWDYKKEILPNYKEFDLTLRAKAEKYFRGITERRRYLGTSAYQWSKDSTNPHGLGEKKSFIPALGKVIWEAPESNYYHAYIYKTKEGKRFGFVRIKHYMPLDENGKDEKEKRIKPYTDLQNLLKYFEEFTEGLVIDQVNNPGGDIFYGYFIASMLTDKIIKTIPEKEILSPGSSLSAYENLKELEEIKTQDDVKKKYKTELLGGLSINLQHIRMLKNYYQAMLEDGSSGKRLSRLNYVLGMEYINPHKSVHYTKPVVILVNELSISAGDFFPALVQDNGLAKILGVKTSGAGGYVKGARIPNTLGIQSTRVTGSIAFRKGVTPIENLGVTPDIIHEFTVKDLTEDYSDYIKKINQQFTK